MIAICDYDAGNIMSVQKACRYLGYDYQLTRDPDIIIHSDHVILPGVGAFGDAMNRLENYGLVNVLHDVCEKGIPFLGICLGLQLLFEESDESPGVRGLGLMDGTIKKIPDQNGELKIPHMGWNSLVYPQEGRLFRNIPEGTDVYFVHSYYLPDDGPSSVSITATAQYGVSIGASIEKGNLFATQFHPEKSGEWGLRILQNFLSL